MSREVRVGAGTDPVAGELIGAMVAEVEAMYGSAVAARPEDLSPPSGAYVTLWEDGRAVAGGGLLRLDDDTCEIKRMYVVPEARGGGAGRELLEALEALGRERGYTAGAARHRRQAAAGAADLRARRLPADRRLQRQPARRLLGREAALGGVGQRPAVRAAQRARAAPAVAGGQAPADAVGGGLDAQRQPVRPG